MGRKKVQPIDQTNQENVDPSFLCTTDRFTDDTSTNGCPTINLKTIIKLLLIYFVFFGDLSMIISFIRDSIGMVFGRGSCSIFIPSTWNSLFLRPVDCSKCSHIKQITELANISSEQFEERFAYSMEPLIVRGIIKSEWKALEVFDLNFFKRLYSSARKPHRCQFFPYKTPYKSLQQALQSIPDHWKVIDVPENSTWYIGWSNCDPEITNVLRQYYKRPSFLPAHSEDSRLNWIFMGTPGYGAPMHIDNVGYPSWQAQIKGMKKWILEPPIECYFQCQRFEVTINSGDIIVVDTNRWFHETQIIGNELSITIGSEYD